METSTLRGPGLSDAPASAVAWGAILAGAVAAMATSIVLLALGAGLGLSAVSPWDGVGASAKAIGVTAVIWLVIVQWLSAGLGGFITGRLRVRWTYFDRDEVFFRDTAHGFLSWAVAVAAVALVTATLSAGVVGMAGSGAAAGAASSDNSTAYFTDSLYRGGTTAIGPAQTNDYRGETSRILSQGMGGEIAAEDRTYLAQLVAARTGLSQDEAQRRVDATITKAKAAADAARKASATLAIATAISLVIGAFIAAVAAGFGGRERDEY